MGVNRGVCGNCMAPNEIGGDFRGPKSLIFVWGKARGVHDNAITPFLEGDNAITL